MTTVRAFEDNQSVIFFAGDEGTGADGALELSFAAVVIVEIFMSGATARAHCLYRDVTLGVLANRDGLNKFTITDMEVFNEFLIIELFRFDDDWWLVNFEFLVFRRVGIVKSPLLEWNIFADK